MSDPRPERRWTALRSMLSALFFRGTRCYDVQSVGIRKLVEKHGPYPKAYHLTQPVEQPANLKQMMEGNPKRTA